MPITAPDADEIARIAEGFGLTLSHDDALTYSEMMSGAVASYDRLDAMADATLPATAVRSAGRPPTEAENPYGAWAWIGHAEGAGRGLLAGKSVGVKDNTCVQGWPMRNGSRLLEGFVADVDATVVTRILAAGGTIHGKTVCEDLSYSGHSHTSQPHPVRNPHDPTRSAGGSSSGSGAAIAAGDVPMALGCDQGGSVRIPAGWCGVVGLKPTFGLVPYTGICPLESSIDHCGPMGATVEDVARLLTVIAGPDGLDPRQPAAFAPVDYLAELGAGLRGMRIGVLSQGFGRPESEAATDEAVRAALARMQAAGAVIEDVSIPAHQDAFDIFNAICIEGTSELMFRAGAGGHGEGFTSMHLFDAFAAAWRMRPEAISPTARMSLLLGEYMQRRYNGRYFVKAQALRAAARAAYDRALQTYDVLAMPTLPFRATPFPPDGSGLRETLTAALPMIGNTAPFNCMGHPAISVPCALRDGLPIGLMLVGRHMDDAATLQAAAGLEALGDWKTW